MKTPDQGNARNLGVLDDTYVTKGDELELNQKKKENAKKSIRNSSHSDKNEPILLRVQQNSFL